MLLNLKLQNLATIKELDIDFTGGFSILTGETGAGKSIMIDAILLVLGGKGDPGMVRSGEDSAVVEAVFDLMPLPEIRDQLQASGIEAGEELIIRCALPAQGRQKRYINGTTVTAEFLKSVGRQLINIHGQHDNQALLQVGSHRDFLDGFGQLEALRSQVAECHRQHQEVLEEQRRLLKRLEARNARSEELGWIIEELEDLQLQRGEEEDLQQEANRLAHTEKLSLWIGQVHTQLNEVEGAVLEQLETLRKALEEAERVDPACGEMRAPLESALFQLEDVHRMAVNYAAGIEEDPERLAWVNERLSRIQRMQRKHRRDSSDALIDLLERALEELAELSRLEEDGLELQQRLNTTAEALRDRAKALTEARRTAAQKLDGQIVKELRELGMENARFETRVEAPDHLEDLAQVTPHGCDAVEFLLSVNPGQALRSLVKVASGGELSRIMLALKTVLTSLDTVEILIFDEVDTGISGRIAEIVGLKLRQLGTRHQTLCITHLPQIAAFSRQHYVVTKEVRQGQTFTQIRMLHGDEEKARELAQLMGGQEISPNTVQLAQEMLKRAAGVDAA